MSIQTYKPIATMITCREEDEEAMVMLGAYRALERENSALREDKERLDWIIGQAHYLFFAELGSDLAKGREQIDAARKEAQP